MLSTKAFGSQHFEWLSTYTTVPIPDIPDPIPFPPITGDIRGDILLESTVNYVGAKDVAPSLLENWVESTHQIANDAVVGDIIRDLQNKKIEFDTKSFRPKYGKREAEEAVLEHIDELSFEFPADIVGGKIKKLKIELSEYFGEVNSKKVKEEEEDVESAEQGQEKDKPKTTYPELLALVTGEQDPDLLNKRKEDEKRMLKGLLRRIKGSDKPYKFIFLEKDLDDNPLMILSKEKIPATLIKASRQRPRRKS